MNAVLAVLFSIIALSVISMAVINFYLIKLVRKLEQEIHELETPF